MARERLTRLRIADLVVGATLGGLLAAGFFPKLGWPALLFVPVCSLTQRFSRISFEKLERETQKETTISLDLDPKSNPDDPNGGAA